MGVTVVASCAGTYGNNASPLITLPAATAGVQAGQLFVGVLQVAFQPNTASTTAAGQLQTSPGGILVEDSTSESPYNFTLLVTKELVAGDVGGNLAWTLPNPGKWTLTGVVLSGHDSSNPINQVAAHAPETAATQNHVTPVTAATTVDGCLWVEYACDRGSANTGWTQPTGQGATVRSTAYGSGGGAPSAVIATSGTVALGAAPGGHTWTSTVSNQHAATYTIAVAPSTTSAGGALVFDEDFERGTNGANLTAGTGGNTGYDQILGVGTATFDTASAAHGTLGAKLVSTTTTNGFKQLVKIFTNVTARYRRFRYKWDAPGSANFLLFTLFDNAEAVRVCDIQQTTGNQLKLRNAAQTQVTNGLSPAITPGTWLDVAVAAYQSGGVTKCRMQLFIGANADGTTPDFDTGEQQASASLLNMGWSAIGCASNIALTQHFDDDRASNTDWPAPVGGTVNQGPTANAGPDRTVTTGATVTLDGTGSFDPDGTITKYAWTQTAGPTVTLSSTSVAAPTFTAPAAAGTLTFSLVVTDDQNAASAADTVTVTVEAAAYQASQTRLGADGTWSEVPEWFLAADGRTWQ